MKKSTQKQQEIHNKINNHKNKNLVKIVVLGAGGVGKTAISTIYIKEKHDFDDLPTIEDYHRKSTEYEGNPFILNIMNQAGRNDNFQNP